MDIKNYIGEIEPIAVEKQYLRYIRRGNKFLPIIYQAEDYLFNEYSGEHQGCGRDQRAELNSDYKWEEESFKQIARW